MNRQALLDKQKHLMPLQAMVANALAHGEDSLIEIHSDEERAIQKKIIQLRIAAYSDNTWASYKSDLLSFILFAKTDIPFPTSSALIQHYLVVKQEQYAPSTLRHHVAALSFIHTFFGWADPTEDTTIQQMLCGIRKQKIKQGWQEKRAPALTAPEIKQVISSIEDDLRGLRDRTLLLVGLVCAFRQNELSTLQIENLEETEDGYEYKVRTSKTDQEGKEDRFKVIPYGKGKICPVTAIKQLINEIGDKKGPLFRGINPREQFILTKNKGKKSTKGMSHTAVNAVIRKRINLSGIIKVDDPKLYEDTIKTYSFHSLRSSFITILRANDVRDSKIMKQTHHTNINIIERYDRPDMRFKNNPASDLINILC